MHSRKLLALSCAAAVSGFGTSVQAADLVIGVPDWPSVKATAHVLKVALEDRMGLEVELQDGSNQILFQAMDAGSVDIHPEVWLPNHDHLKAQFIDGKQSVRINPNAVEGEQAMCVTKGTAERTGIVALKELTDTAMAQNFDSDNDGKGEIWIGAPTWGSTVIEKIRARSYGYDKTMTLKEMDETPAMEAVGNAVNNDQNIVFFCYTPHHMFNLHELVRLEEPDYDQKQWMIVQPGATPGWLERSRAGVAWDTANLHIAYATSLETEHPDIAASLATITLDAETLSAMTYALVVENQDPAEFAGKWVEENSARVDEWFQ